jgi:hypothetical protein
LLSKGFGVVRRMGDQMRRLLHNARTFYSDILKHKAPLMSFDELKEETGQITKILDAAERTGGPS